MVRNLLGTLLALIGAAAAAWSPFRAWYGARLGRDYLVRELFSSAGITGTQASLWTGLFMPMLGAGVLTLLAVLMRSRLLLALTGLLVLGFTVLWMIRQGQDAGTLTAGAGGLGDGVGYAIGGGVLLLIASLVMRGRRPRGRRRKGRHSGRVDDSYAASAAVAGPDDREFSEMPQPYGPFGTTHGPHEAYQADDWPPYERSHHPYYYDDSTPPEEWDPWAPRNPGPTSSPVSPPEDRPGRPGQGADQGAEPGADQGEPGAPGGQPPQGPQQQPPASAGPDTEAPAEQDGHGPQGTQRIPRRPDHRGGGTSE
ncbi:hypothetical protein [Streptomyces abyssalis]|uniref:hypothetical protein n=1 Tax=Streptomyces abyssalis TaxID=933944 RepID=UPI00085BC132|nr:hypothetical protein [Streptomyces abyssalis]